MTMQMANLRHSAVALLVCLLQIIPVLAAVAQPVDTSQFRRCTSGQSTYDFIVVGGGTAGLTVATRLSQRLSHDCILVIEAGDDGRDDPRIFIPGRKGQTFGTKYDWNLTTVPQPNANNRVIGMTRGKVLGGSSALNLMTWDRGSTKDYDAWEELGNPGWNWSTMLASMLKVENFVSSPEYQGPGVGTGGIIQTLMNRILPLQQLSFIPTLNSLGIKTNLASLGGHLIGVMRQPTNIRLSDYTRSYSTAYLAAAERNLVVRTNSRVAKINFSGTTASGVTLDDGTIISVNQEVILSAGAFQSPGLLELSGIGNPKILQAAGVTKVISNLPGVGENLQDHTRIQSAYRLTPDFISFDRLRYNATYAAIQLALYNANVPSAYDYTGSGYAYLNWSQVSTSIAANLVTLAHQSANLSNPIDRKKLSYLTDPTLTPLQSQLEIIFSDGYTGVKGYPSPTSPLYGAEFFSLLAASVHPFSRGTVHISSPSISVPPTIDPKYLSNPYDLQAMIVAAKYMRTLTTTAPLSSIWSTEYEPGPTVVTDADWEAYARADTLSIYHPVGTCAMLPRSDGGVVDPKLRVYGVKGLRVVDASIIPIIPGAHIQTAVYGIAEMAADIIVADCT